MSHLHTQMEEMTVNATTMAIRYLQMFPQSSYDADMEKFNQLVISELNQQSERICEQEGIPLEEGVPAIVTLMRVTKEEIRIVSHVTQKKEQE